MEESTKQTAAVTSTAPLPAVTVSADADHVVGSDAAAGQRASCDGGVATCDSASMALATDSTHTSDGIDRDTPVAPQDQHDERELVEQVSFILSSLKHSIMHTYSHLYSSHTHTHTHAQKAHCLSSFFFSNQSAMAITLTFRSRPCQQKSPSNTKRAVEHSLTCSRPRAALSAYAVAWAPTAPSCVACQACGAATP